MHTLTASTKVVPEDWNRELAGLQSCPFHSHQWSCYSAENNGQSPLYFTLRDAAGGVAALTHGLVVRRFPRRIPVFRSLSFGSLPAYSTPEALDELIGRIRDYAAGHGFMTVEWNSFGSPEACRLTQALPKTGKKRWEFLIALGDSEEALWKRLHGKKRNMIAKAKKSGLRVDRAHTLEQLRDYRQLAMQTWQRKTAMGIPFPKPPEEATLEKMRRHLIDHGLGRFYLAYDDAAAVAGAFFLEFAGTAYYVLSAAAEEGLKKSAPDLLIWNAMVDSRNSGCRTLNLGGLAESELNGLPLEQAGLYHFKERFSATIHPCFTAGIVLNPLFYRLWKSLGKIKKGYRGIGV